jgi:hypothetical protein
MMYEPSRPPKITISEAITHQTARRPVGMPAAERVVAIGLADIDASSPGQFGAFCGQ